MGSQREQRQAQGMVNDMFLSPMRPLVLELEPALRLHTDTEMLSSVSLRSHMHVSGGYQQSGLQRKTTMWTLLLLPCMLVWQASS